MTDQPSSARTGRTMVIATLVSRITGFVRTLALVAALGLGTRLLDAYTAANVLPNSIYELVMGGAAASVLVPLLVRVTADDGVNEDLFTQRLLSLVFYGLSAVVIVTISAAPTALAYALGLAVGVGLGGSFAVVCAATAVGACLYVLIARLLRVSEFTILTAGLRVPRI
ncbi:lipid II flippase MurJ [Nonomuraea spiralis]|uniref:lipid II flippase MurJ n=1 Tax=Nonomuraea spiralis TaxID=46182 RepID=UPI0037B0FDE2